MFDEKIKAKLNGICKAQGRLSAIKYIRTHLATTMSLLEAKRTLDNEIPEEKLDKVKAILDLFDQLSPKDQKQIRSELMRME